jgi:hypothetical protein
MRLLLLSVTEGFSGRINSSRGIILIGPTQLSLSKQKTHYHVDTFMVFSTSRYNKALP